MHVNQQDQRPLAIALMGPTASGKTAAAVECCARWNAEVVSVDSALVYRRLNIGSAKPDAELLRHAPHHLIDIRDPHESYSAAEFSQDALRAMNALNDAGKLPLLVGGTGLYFRALLRGLSDMPAADSEVRAQIQARAQSEGWGSLHQELARIDPEAAAKIKPGDSQRISRALEVWQLSGRAISHWQTQSVQPQDFPFRVLKLILAPPDRKVLHERIEQRFDQMLDQGFIDELRGLQDDPRLHADLPSMRAVGYRQGLQFLRGEVDFEDFRERGIAATRQLAKRQFTWLRSEQDARWLDPTGQAAEIFSAINAFVTRN